MDVPWSRKEDEMDFTNKQYTTSDGSIIHYYEIENNNPILLMIHAQGTNASSFFKV